MYAIRQMATQAIKHSAARSASNSPKKMSKIVWIDMEMTGLNIHKDRIMEVACLITDNDLNVLAENDSIVIHQPDSLLNAMDEWCKSTHGRTGLWAECQKSTITETKAEQMLLDFLEANNVVESSSPLAGNTIYMDRMFLREFMPKVDAYLNYRIIDVSTVKELSKRWNTGIFARAPKKRNVHRGLDDIKESIDELKYYKHYMFRKKSDE